MIEHWATKYITMPYKSKGRDCDGVDCWGLVYLAWKNEKNILLPKYEEGYSDAEQQKEVSAIMKKDLHYWKEVNKPDEFDIVLMRLAGEPWHVGLMINKKEFIHILSGTKVTKEKINSSIFKHRIMGYYTKP